MRFQREQQVGQTGENKSKSHATILHTQTNITCAVVSKQEERTVKNDSERIEPLLGKFVVDHFVRWWRQWWRFVPSSDPATKTGDPWPPQKAAAIVSAQHDGE